MIISKIKFSKLVRRIKNVFADLYVLLLTRAGKFLRFC